MTASELSESWLEASNNFKGENMNIFKKLFKREKSEPQIEEDLLPPLPEEAYDKEIGKYCTYNTKTQKITASVPLHEIVLDVPVSKKYYQSSGCKKSRIRIGDDFKNFVIFHSHRDGESWMHHRNIEHITAVKFINGEPMEVFDTDINTRWNHPKYGAKYLDAPSFYKIAGDFDDFVGDSNLVAYYIEDECKLLYDSGSRAGKNKGKKYGLRKEVEDLIKLDDYRFDSVLAHYGITYDKDDLPGSTIAQGYLFMLVAKAVIEKQSQ